MTQPSSSVQVNILGDFRIVISDGGQAGIRPRSRQLLAYLILNRDSPQPRRRVASMLWPDTLDSQARTNLRKELHHLRKAFPVVEQLLVTTPQTLQWQPQIPCTLDLETFETALAQAESTTGAACLQHLETVLHAYPDDLWPDCDADWIYPDQERLKQQRVSALNQITRLLQELGEPTKAIPFGQQWLHAAPLDEGCYQTLMALYATQGDRATALQLYHQCMTTLQTELGIAPSAPTAALYQQILENDAIAAEQNPDSAESPATALLDASSIPEPLPLSLASPRQAFIGRDDLFSTLEQWLLGHKRAAAPVLLLSGEPGIGKTRLLEALAESAAHHRFQVCWGRAFAAEQLRSYGVWIDLLRSLNQENPSLGVLSANLRDRGQLLDQVVQHLGTTATPEQPLLLLFDDIHWLDESSTTLLHYVFRLLGQRSLRLACAVRGAELQENSTVLNLVKSLRRANRLQEVAVPPLSVEAVAALVQTLQAKAPAHGIDPKQIYLDSGGNPLFAMEAARAVTQGSNGLSDLIEDRLHRLDQSARDLLPWAAALGRRFSPEILALAASYPPMAFLTAIEQLERQQIVRPVCSPLSQDLEEYDFVHDLIRQVAYGQLSQPRRRLIHGLLAKTLHSQAVDDDLASQVAYHAELAGNHLLAAEASVAAADRSLRLFAYRDVVQLVVQGLKCCQSLPSRDRLRFSAQLLRIRVMAGVAPGNTAEITAQIQQVQADIVGLSIPDAEVNAQEALILLTYDQGNLAAVHEQATQALASLPLSPRLQAESLAGNGCCLTEIERDMDRAEAVLLEAQAIADHMGLKLMDVSTGLGCVERYRGNYDQARRYLNQAHQLAQNQQNHIRQGYALLHLVMTGWDQRQPQVADVQALLTISAHLPQGSEGAFAQAIIALGHYLDEAGSTQALDQALLQLDRLDAQRKVVFVASHACEVALSHHQSNAAQRYAALTDKAAQRVEHPNDLAIAVALQILCTEADEDCQGYGRSLQTALSERFRLSARAQALLEQAQQTAQQPMSKLD